MKADATAAQTSEAARVGAGPAQLSATAPQALDRVSPPVGTVDTVDCFAHSCAQTRVLNCPVDRVYDALFRVAEWPDHLPHVLGIEVVYDDGQYQEFWMTVASQNDVPPLRVRSIRNCRARQIEFFQPTPPRFLRHHAGIWRFASEGSSACEVTVTHVWNLEEGAAAEMFPAVEGRSTAQRVADMLADHSRLALSSWQRVLTAEEGAE